MTDEHITKLEDLYKEEERNTERELANQTDINRYVRVVESMSPDHYCEPSSPSGEQTAKQGAGDSEEDKKPAFEVDLGLGKKKRKDFVQENVLRTMGPKSVIKMIDKANPPLSSHNIPYLSNNTRFSRGELHTLYTMYKALCHATSQRYGVLEYDPVDGMDGKVFRNGVYQVFIQSDLLAERIFNTIDYNYSNFMNWPEFISGMQMIKAKTLADKIGLFIKLADSDGNRMLSAEEIETLCTANLARYVKPAGDEFFNSLVEYFKKAIFQSLGYAEDEEIPLESMKEYILAGKENAHLLSMFCGADF